MDFYERLALVFAGLENDRGLKRQRVMLNSGLDSAQYQAYKRANRLPSLEMLQRLATCDDFPLTLHRLQAFKAIEKYGSAILYDAIEVLKAEKSVQVNIARDRALNSN